MIKNKFYKINDIGKRICLISDIHYSSNYDLKIFEEIISNIKENKPDYICISGDLVDDVAVLYESPDALTNFIKKLSKISPTIITKGNHDETNFLNYKHTYLTNEEYFLNLNTIENVYYLDNKTLVRDNITFTSFNLSYGYYNTYHESYDVFKKEMDKKIKKINPLKYNILLCHTPINIFKNHNDIVNKFDLILSGHMHNGLVFDFLDRKGNRGFFGPFESFFPKNARGKITKKIEEKDKNLIISGGVIKFANNNPKFFHKLNKLYPISIDYIDI